MATQRKTKTKPKGFAATFRESLNSMSIQIEIDIAIKLSEQPVSTVMLDHDDVTAVDPHSGNNCKVTFVNINIDSGIVEVSTIDGSVAFPVLEKTFDLKEFGIEDKLTILEALEAATA